MNFFVFLQKLENKLEPVPRRNDNLKCDYFLVLSTVLTKNRFRVFDFLKMMISKDLCKDNHQLLLVRRAGCPPAAPPICTRWNEKVVYDDMVSSVVVE